jgi:hypothetical protein
MDKYTNVFWGQAGNGKETEKAAEKTKKCLNRDFQD